MVNPSAQAIKVVPLADRPDCIPALAQWLYEEFGYFHDHDSPARRTLELQGRLGRGVVPMTFVAVAGDAPDAPPIGTASLTPDDLDTHPELTPWLASVLVHPQWRGRGVGEALVRAVMAEAAAQGHSPLYLFATDRASWYAKLGWQEVSREPYRDQQVTIMKVG